MGEARPSEAEGSAMVEANVAEVLEKLTDWPAHMAARFNGAVYLVGSVLHHPFARDVDIRIVISDEEFAARYRMERERQEFGEHHPMAKRGLTSALVVPFQTATPSQRWIDDVSKFGGALSKRLGRNVDVKVWPESHWHPPYPEAITLAAPTPRWFFYSKHCADPSLVPAPTPTQREAE